MPLFSPSMKYFEQVARHGSIQEAARRMNVAASAVNRQILNLEQEMGSLLFERGPRGMRLTLAGQTLLLDVRRWFADAERLKGTLDAMRGLNSGTVRIATMGCFERGFLPELVASFTARHPSVRFEIQITGTTASLDLLVSGEVDLALAFNLPNRRDIQKFATQPWPIGVVMRDQHPLVGQERLRLVDCVPYDVLLPGDTLALSTIVQDLLTRMGERRPPSVTTNSVSFMKSMIRRTNALGFMTRVDAQPEVDEKGLIFMELAERNLPVDILSLAARRDRAPLPAVDSFTQVLLQSLEASTASSAKIC
jgi:DNA-binding transcriptional LysR family regulator